MPAPGSSSNPTEVRQRYRARIAPVATPLLLAHQAITRRAFASLGVIAAALAVSAALVFVADWPDVWWRDPISLGRAALVAVIIGLAVHRVRRESGPLTADARSVEDGIRRELLPLTFRMLRDDARYTPTGAIDRGWIRRSALIAHVSAYESAHLVRWTFGGAERQMAEVDTLRSTRTSDGPDSDEVIFKGLVAIAALAGDTGGQVRLWSEDLIHPPPESVSGLPRVDTARLGAPRDGLPPTHALDSAFVVEATAPHVAARVVNTAVVARLNAAHAAGLRVRVSYAYRELFVAVDLDRRWFDGLAMRFDEDHVAAMGDVLDLVDGLASAVGSDAPRG